jgi:hypothetical protein
MLWVLKKFDCFQCAIYIPCQLARRSGDNFNPERFAAPVKAANTSGPGADSDAKPDSGRGLGWYILCGNVVWVEKVQTEVLTAT